MDRTAGLSSMPQWLWVPIIALAAVQIGVEVYALIRLFRTPDDRLQFGKKWPWVLIILFVNLAGAIVFLVAGRKPAPAVDPFGGPEQASPSGQAAHVADVLYGSRESDRS